MAPDNPAHPQNCMCDSCMNARVRERIDARAKAVLERKLEEQAQAYIKRRGGVDPRRDSARNRSSVK